MAYDKVKYLPAVKRIPDALWNEARLLILPSEKQDNIIRRPAAVSFRKIFDGIVYVLECLKNWCQYQWKIDVAKGVWFSFDMS